MSSIRQIAWPRIFAEAVAIVASILLAFWIDAWWEDIAERALEQEYLSALIDDFGATRESLANYIGFSTRVLDSADQILAIAATPDSEPVPDSFSKTLGDAYGIQRPSPITSTYQDMVNSGNLRLIEDRDLRLAMAELMELLDEIDFYSNSIVETYWTHHAPFVDRNFVVSEFGWFIDATGTVGNERAELFGETPEPPFDTDVSVVRTREFWNLMFGWKTMYADQLSPVIRARNLCDEILESLSIEVRGGEP